MNKRVSFDILPESRLAGLHMLGTVEKRFLINYAVEPTLLQFMVPPGSELSLFKRKAWLSACFVTMNDMRPSFVNSKLGMSYHYLIFRTRARLLFPDGKLRDSVLVLDPNINKTLLALGGTILTKIKFSKKISNFQKVRINLKSQCRLECMEI